MRMFNLVASIVASPFMISQEMHDTGVSNGRGRNADYSAPPAQIRTGAANASNVAHNI